ncbi:MAG: hypothetical protein EBU12_09265 [Microbacteriaceae bacterium]|nr:hypothetical protein [Microbacteriaceae bacterium]
MRIRNAQKKQNAMKVKQVYLDNNEMYLISMEEAIERLEAYWKKEEIEKLLIQGQTLFTPYAEYTINQ